MCRSIDSMRQHSCASATARPSRFTSSADPEAEANRPPQSFVQSAATGTTFTSGAGWSDPDNEYWVDGFTTDGLTSGGPCWTNCNNNNEAYSFHTGGNMSLFGDGSVRFLRDSLTVRVFAQMVSKSQGEVYSE